MCLLPAPRPSPPTMSRLGNWASLGHKCLPATPTSLDPAPLPPAAARAYGRRDSRRRPRPETLRDGKDFLHLRSTTLLSQMKRAIVQHRFSPAKQPRSAPLRDLHLFHVELAAPTGSKLWVQVIGPGQFCHTLRSIKTLFCSRHPTPPWIGRPTPNSPQRSHQRQLDQTDSY